MQFLFFSVALPLFLAYIRTVIQFLCFLIFLFMKNSIDANGFSKVERAEISRNFRDEIKLHGLANAILSVVESASAKALVRKNVFVQQCRKPNFAAEFSSACKRLAETHPEMAVKIKTFRAEITGK